MSLFFQVDGVPVAQARTRHGLHNSYYPAKTKAYRDKVTFIAKREMNKLGEKMYEKGEALYFQLVVVRKIPKSWSKVKQNDALLGRIYPTSVPDCSNYLKAIEDSLNGVCYYDDSAIVEELVQKSYGEKPCVRIFVTSMKEKDAIEGF